MCSQQLKAQRVPGLMARIRDVSIQAIALSMAYGRHGINLPLEEVDPLDDQGAVPLPFHQGLLQQLDQPFGLPGIVTAGLQIADPLFLLADPLAAFLDVEVGFYQKALLVMELLGAHGKGCGHGGVSLLSRADRRIKRL